MFTSQKIGRTVFISLYFDKIFYYANALDGMYVNAHKKWPSHKFLVCTSLLFNKNNPQVAARATRLQWLKIEQKHRMTSSTWLCGCRTKWVIGHRTWSIIGHSTINTVDSFVTRLRTRQNFEPVHIIGPVQNFGPPARNFGPLRAEFAWREWRKTLGGHVANWAGLSGFSPRENKISHTFFIDFINKYSKVSNAHNSDDCHGVFNGGMLNKGWSFSRSRFDCLGLMHFFHG